MDPNRPTTVQYGVISGGSNEATPLAWNNSFGDMGFPDAERAYGAVLRHAKRACCWWIPSALKCFKGAGEPHRTPALMAGFNAVPCASAARRPAGSLLSWNNSFGDIGFPDAERAYGAVLRHLPWPVLRHAKRNFFVRQHWLFDTPAPQPVAGRRRLPKRCFGSGCARPVATLKGARGPHRTPALFAGIDAVPCASAPRPRAGRANSDRRVTRLAWGAAATAATSRRRSLAIAVPPAEPPGRSRLCRRTGSSGTR